MGKEYKFVEAKYKGELVQFEKQRNGDYKLTRILSTNPKAFLNEELKLGKIVDRSNIDKITNHMY